MAGEMSGPAPEERIRPEGRRNAQGIRVDPEVEAEPAVRRTVMSVLVTHEPGVLAEVSGLFSRRQFNIESLTVGPTIDDDYARITLVVEEPEPGIEQVRKQLSKLLPVISVCELEADALCRELALIKVDATHPDRVNAVADMYDATAVDAGPETATFEVTGSRQKIEAAVEAFDRFEVHEIVRTGTAALARGPDRTGELPAVSGIDEPPATSGIDEPPAASGIDEPPANSEIPEESQATTNATTELSKS